MKHKPILDLTLTPELIAEGKARDFVHKINRIRRAKDYDIRQRIIIYANTNEVAGFIDDFQDYIMQETLATSIHLTTETTKLKKGSE